MKIAFVVALSKIIAGAAFALAALTSNQPVDQSVTFEPSATLDATQVKIASLPEEDEPGWDCHTMGNLNCG